MSLVPDGLSRLWVKSARLRTGDSVARTPVSILTSLVPPGGVFDTRAVLAQHPQLKADKALVLDIVFEEYCRRREAGEAIDLDEFCGRFPTYQASVRRLLEVETFLDDRS